MQKENNKITPKSILENFIKLFKVKTNEILDVSFYDLSKLKKQFNMLIKLMTDEKDNFKKSIEVLLEQYEFTFPIYIVKNKDMDQNGNFNLIDAKEKKNLLQFIDYLSGEIFDKNFKSFLLSCNEIKNFHCFFNFQNYYGDNIPLYNLLVDIFKNFLSLVSLDKKLEKLEKLYEISIIQKIKEKNNDSIELKDLENDIHKLKQLWINKNYDNVFFDSAEILKKIIILICKRKNIDIKNLKNRNMKDYAKAIKEYLKLITEEDKKFEQINSSISNLYMQVIAPLRNASKKENFDMELSEKIKKMKPENKKIFSLLYIDLCKTFMNIFLLNY